MKAHCACCGAEVDVELAPLAEVPRAVFCATCEGHADPPQPSPAASVDLELLDDPGAVVKVGGSFG